MLTRDQREGVQFRLNKTVQANWCPRHSVQFWNGREAIEASSMGKMETVFQFLNFVKRIWGGKNIHHRKEKKHN